MNVLITGSSGFVGTNLVDYLNNKGIPLQTYSRKEGDDYGLIDKIYLNHKQISAIVHLAGKAHDLKKTSNSNDYYRANTELTMQLFDAFLHSQVSVFIYISSIKSLTDHADIHLTENMRPSPLTDYGKSKLAAENYIVNQKLPHGKSVYILRPCMIHGSGNKGNLNLLYKFVKQGIPYPLAGFTNRRSFLSITNFCFVIQQLLNRPEIASGVYHLADTDPISTNELIRLIGEEMQKPVRLWRIPKTLMKTIARVGDILHLPLNTERLEKLTENYIVDNTKIKAAIGQELPVTVQDGLRRTIASFQA